MGMLSLLLRFFPYTGGRIFYTYTIGMILPSKDASTWGHSIQYRVRGHR